MKNSTTLALLFALALLPLLTATAGAGQPAPEKEVPQFALGRPARAEAVSAALLAVETGPVDHRLALVHALATSGGAAAVDALAALLADPELEVRRAVLEVAPRLGLRSEAVRRRLLKTLGVLSPVDRALALRALGTFGDGRDVPRLLALGDDEDEDPAVRCAAFDALSALSGANLPYDASRWREWWRGLETRSRRDVALALGLLEADPDRHAHAALSVLDQYAWMAMPSVTHSISRWLYGDRPASRRTACKLITKLRLADYADAVERTLRFAREAHLMRAARECMATLGVVIE